MVGHDVRVSRHTCSSPLVIGLIFLFFVGAVHAEDCGDPFSNGVGPFDYTNPADRRDPLRIPIVEKHHFNMDIQTLKGGQTGAYIMTDLDYLLRAVPNHHRGLYTMARLYTSGVRTDGAKWSADCYFQRALHFRPTDGVVYMVYGIFLSKQGKFEEAIKNYRQAMKLLPESAELYYNMGLLYLDQKDYEKAMSFAEKAYALGYPLPGLKDSLKRKNAWNPSIDLQVK